MYSSIRKVGLSVFCLFFFITAKSQNITVFHSVQPLPSPYISDWELDPALTFMQITSTDPDAYQIIVQVIVTEQNLGEVLRAESVPIDVTAGGWSLRINNTDFANWDKLKYNESIKQTIDRTGKLPDGSYTICSYIKFYPDEHLLAQDCANFNVIQPQPPVLVYPIAEEVVQNTYPLFQWTPVQTTPSNPVRYRVKIVEVLQNQHPQEAMQVNASQLNNEVDGKTNFLYDPSQLPLESGKRYAWQVQSLDRLGNPFGQNNGSSEVESFYFQFDPSKPYIDAIAPGNNCSGSVSTRLNTASVTFTWQAKGNFSEYYVCVTENPCGKYPPHDPTTPGKPTTITPTGGRVTTTGVVPKTTTQQINTGTQTNNQQTTLTSVTDAASGLQNSVLPDAISQSFEQDDPALGNMLYVSPAIKSNTGFQDNYYNQQTTPSSHSVTLNLDGVVQPGAAFTYYICATELSTNTVVTSQTKCDRYSPTTTTGEVPSEVPCPKVPTCQIEIIEDVEPKMDGGLTAFSKTLTEISRDDFIPLEAEGLDFDKVIWKCIPKDGCPEDGSERKAPLTGRVKFTWEIIEGEGFFKKLGCLPDLKSDEGEHVIFQPPFVELPKDDKPLKKITKIKLQVIDDNTTQPIDATVERIVTIETSRKKASPNKYSLKITSDAYVLPKAPAKEDKIGKCKATDPVWKNNDDFTKPSIELPPVADNDKMVVGEMMILKVADQRDNDEFNVECLSQLCTSTKDKKVYEDDVQFNWKILSGSGKILGKAKGRTIIYRAVMTMAETKDKELIKIECEVVNPFGLQILDKPKKGEISFYVHNAGVKVSHPDGKWLPEDDNSVEVTSSLKYKDGSEWKDGLAHQCRIHFLELKDVSKEPGICLNEPVKNKADKDKCVDLYLKDESEHEAFSAPSTTSSCNAKDLFQEARTKKPVKEYKINVYSRDFGSYGFLRSYANINTNPADGQVSGTPQYYSIPVKKSDVTHPNGRAKKKEYKDNRVTIPMDIDENHICDGGWDATIGGKHIPDPQDNLEDKDEKPKGDGNNGDGYSNYEEYRGFKVTSPSVNHVRLNNTKKDLFINNEDNLPVANFETQSELTVHLIDEAHYNKNSERVVNFNYATAHTGDQCGLHLVDAGNGADGLLGIAIGAGDKPNPPNWEKVINVYAKSITAYCKSKKLDNASKLAQVTAHELGHGCNLFHHGESSKDNQNNEHGVRSGDFSCIMRYDNCGSNKESIGSVYCTGSNGAGANNNPASPAGFGAAAASRGNCKEQFRVNHNTPYPDRSLKK